VLGEEGEEPVVGLQDGPGVEGGHVLGLAVLGVPVILVHVAVALVGNNDDLVLNTCNPELLLEGPGGADIGEAGVGVLVTKLTEDGDSDLGEIKVPAIGDALERGSAVGLVLGADGGGEAQSTTKTEASDSNLPVVVVGTEVLDNGADLTNGLAKVHALHEVLGLGLVKSLLSLVEIGDNGVVTLVGDLARLVGQELSEAPPFLMKEERKRRRRRNAIQIQILQFKIKGVLGILQKKKKKKKKKKIGEKWGKKRLRHYCATVALFSHGRIQQDSNARRKSFHLSPPPAPSETGNPPPLLHQEIRHYSSRSEWQQEEKKRKKKEEKILQGFFKPE